MTEPHVIISGASIAGLSSAFWLRRAGWQVTLLERAESFREGGQNIDVRGVARDALDRMGLTEAVRAENTTETATVIVDGQGDVVAELPSDGPDGATAELEILRGDLARVIFEALPDGVEVGYGDPITAVDEGTEDGSTGVRVQTRSGRSIEADLLVVAEGVRSATRDLVFTDAVERNELGIVMAFGTIPRTSVDDDRWRWYNAPQGRQVHLRPDNHGTTRAILAYAEADEQIASATTDEVRQRLRERFSGAGWQSERVLEGFDQSEDVYVDNLTQISCSAYHRGRVVLVGDAAWCVTPIGGGGSSLALTGGYLLGAYLTSTPLTGSSADDSARIETALRHYEEWMRPLVEDAQSLPPGIQRLAFPRTELGVQAQHLAYRVLTSKPLAPVSARLTQVADADRELPEMPSPER